jgi:hypothetical protein
MMSGPYNCYVLKIKDLEVIWTSTYNTSYLPSHLS